MSDCMAANSWRCQNNFPANLHEVQTSLQKYKQVLTLLLHIGRKAKTKIEKCFLWLRILFNIWWNGTEGSVWQTVALLKKMNDLQRKVSNSAESNLHFPLNISFSGNKRSERQNGDAPDKCSWVSQRKRGLTSFSEWMKMTYAVGLHESKLSHQGYPVQQCSVWFRNCSLVDLGRDGDWLCPLGLGRESVTMADHSGSRLAPRLCTKQVKLHEA